MLPLLSLLIIALWFPQPLQAAQGYGQGCSVGGLQRMSEKETTTQDFLREWFTEKSLNWRLNGNNKQVSAGDGAEGERK